MRITLLTFGVRGDVQPFIALGLGLQAAGHTVRMVAQAEFYDLITRYGLACAPISLDVRQAWQAQKRPGFQPLAMSRLLSQYARQAFLEMWEAAQDAEALIFNYMGRIPGLHLTEKLHIPAYLGLINPQQMHLFYPQRYMNDVGEPVVNLKKTLTHWMQSLIYMPLINRWRKQVLGLSAAPLIGCDRWLTEWQIPILCSYSAQVYPKRPEWPAHTQLTGYWFLERSSDWQPPAALLDFIAAGPPPVCVGFSSVTHLELPNMTEVIIQGLALAQQRGILLSGWNTLGKDVTLPKDIFVADALPHDWLFSQVAAVVHHGGVGTTAAAMRAGVPAVVVPFVVDEPFWGWRVAHLGLGPTPIPPKQLTAEKLAAAVREAVQNNEMRVRARRFSEQLRAEDGVACAVEWFHHYLAHPTGSVRDAT